MSEASSLAGRKHERVPGSRTVNGDPDPGAPIVTLARLATARDACHGLRNRPYREAIDELAFDLQRIFEARVVAIRDGGRDATPALAPEGLDAREWIEMLDRLQPSGAAPGARCFSVAQGDRWPSASDIAHIVVVPLERRNAGALYIGFEQSTAPTNEELRCFELLGESVASALGRLELTAAREPEGRPARHESDPASSDFFSIAAHELRTPLTPITMLLQTLERKARIGVVDIEAIIRTRKQVQRLSLMICDLLDLTRLREDRLTFTPVLVELRSALSQAVSHSNENDSKRQVELVAPDDGLVTVADEPRLTHAFSSLIEHLIRVTSADDVVRVELGCDGARAKVLISSQRPHRELPGVGVVNVVAPRAQPQSIAVLLARALLARFGATVSFGDVGTDPARVEVTLPLVGSTGA